MEDMKELIRQKVRDEIKSQVNRTNEDQSEPDQVPTQEED